MALHPEDQFEIAQAKAQKALAGSAPLHRKSKLRKPKQPKRKKKPKKRQSIGIEHNLGPSLNGLDDRCMTFHEWCLVNSLSLRSGRRILQGQDPPQTIQLTTRRIGITVRANREWQARRSRGR
jgi:hypothetical protein